MKIPLSHGMLVNDLDTALHEGVQIQNSSNILIPDLYDF